MALLRKSPSLSALIVLLGVLPGGVLAQDFDEYQVKAAFLYNFAKFVEWPRQAFQNPHDPIVICVLGHNPFGRALENAVSGKVVADRPLLVQMVSDSRQSGCQILFVSATDRKRFLSTPSPLRTIGVLIVGESEGFAEEGGVINFKRAGDRVRFEINIAAADHEQLRISSKLLSLAEIIKK